MGLAFGKNGGLVLLITGIMIGIVIILGFIIPKRFPRTFAITLVDDYEDILDLSPQPLKRWKGVGSGFYRNARAFFHADYRISGKVKGAISGLYATRYGNIIKPCGGFSLYRETIDGDWEEIPNKGVLIRFGVIYRIGEQGPYFQLSSK